MEHKEYEMIPEQQTAEQIEIIQQPELGMRWFNFLIYFSLFAGALLSLFDGIVYIAGLGSKLPEIFAEAYYFLPNNFRALEIIFGLVILAAAAGSVYVRFQLAGFKKNAPKCFYVFEIALSVFSTVYSIAGMALTTDDGISAIIGAIIGGVVGDAVFLLCNITYFNKRKHLFVN